MNTVLVFDIETIPDIDGARRLSGLADDLNDDDVANILFTQRQQEAGTTMLRHHLQRIVAISAIFRQGADKLKVWSLGSEAATEKSLLEHFFSGLEKYTPTLVSWNGTSFDLPVMHYRAMIHSVSAARYWEVGDHESSFRWNNYINRYHYRHLDMMDVLAGYQPRNNVRLDDMATLMGFPGKMGMDGSRVWPEYQQGNIKAIRDYCETDVLNTFLVYLRFELFRGNISVDEYQTECTLVKTTLKKENQPHFDAFLSNWEQGTEVNHESIT